MIPENVLGGRRRARIRTTILLVLVGILVIISLLAPLLAPNDPDAMDSKVMNKAPCREFPLGTDRYGRCVLSRVLIGSRTSIFSALLLVIITFAVGTFLGMLAGYYGGVIDTIVMRLVDILLAFPQMACHSCRRHSRRWNVQRHACHGYQRMDLVREAGKSSCPDA